MGCGQVDCIVAHDSSEGRLDHVLANIDTLFQAPHLTSTPVYLVSGNSLSCLLKPGRNAIEVDQSCHGRWCSLVPIGHPCSEVTTTGLAYNLGNFSYPRLSLLSLPFKRQFSMLTLVCQ